MIISRKAYFNLHICKFRFSTFNTHVIELLSLKFGEFLISLFRTLNETLFRMVGLVGKTNFRILKYANFDPVMGLYRFEQLNLG